MELPHSPSTTCATMLSDTDSTSSSSRPSSFHRQNTSESNSCDESQFGSITPGSIDCSAVTELDNMNLTTISNIQSSCQSEPQTLSVEEYQTSKSNPIITKPSSITQKSRPMTMKKKAMKKKRIINDDIEDIPSPEEIKYVQYLQKAELMLKELNEVNNVYDFNEIYNFHERYCDMKDATQSTVVSLNQTNESQPMILLYRDIKGFTAMASYSAASVLAIPDGTNMFKNPDVRVYTKDTTPYKDNPDLQPKINLLGVDETNYGYIIFADYYTCGTKLYEVEVVEEESILESQNAIEAAVLSLQNLSVQKFENSDLECLKKDQSTRLECNVGNSFSKSSLVSYTNLAPTNTGMIFNMENYSHEVKLIPSGNNCAVLDKLLSSEEIIAARLAKINHESNICLGGEGSMVSESGKRYVAKSIEGMQVFISTETARFRRGPKIANPIKITLKGALEIHIDYNEKIRKMKYKFTH